MTSSPTSGPHSLFQDRSGESWVALRECLDAQLDPFGQRVLARLAPQSGARALDVGCGTGATLLQLAELVGPRGEVVGIDVSEPMLECAEERVREGGYAQVDMLLDDAQTHVFLDRYFDLAFSRFGLMFFADALAGFDNVCRALRRGGRLGFVSWQGRERNAWADVPLAALRRVAPALAAPQFLESSEPGPFFLSDPDKIRALLAASGFTHIEITAVEQTLHFGASASVADAVEFGLKIGPAARLVAEAEPALRPEFRAALAEALQPFASERGVWLEAAAWSVYAERA